MWNPWIVGLHVVSDGLIALSYFCIPMALVYFVRHRTDLPFNWVFWMFALFIVSCGTTHAMEIWTVWHAWYLAAGVIKAATAAVSVGTAVMLIPLLPRALALPSSEQLRVMNEQLSAEVAERRRVEEELRRTLAERNRSAAALEAANLELGSFTYSVSHDLRAPLRHIGGFARILTEDFAAEMSAEAQRHVRRIEEGAHRMGVLVDELLNLSHVGRQALSLHPASLNAVVEDVISLLQPEIAERKVRWKVASLPWAECDPVLMRQVFQNLIGNALKFTRPRECAAIEIDWRQEGEEMVISVADNGVGFDMQYADKLFGVFQRLHRTEDFEGTGVGLATVYRIIQKHGGRIWAESGLDQGARFFFSLRLAQAQPEAEPSRDGSGLAERHV
jgi:signal transduction histidine kinase